MQVIVGERASGGRALVAALLAFLSTAALPPPVVAKPTYTPEERAAAIVRPAVVYLEMRWEGWVRNRSTGRLWDEKSVTVSAQCSGFAVSGDGYLVTAGHCVDPGVQGMAPAFYAVIAERYRAAGLVNQSQSEQMVKDMASNSEVEGERAGEPAVPKVFVQRGQARSGLTSGEAIEARVVGFHPVSEGDVAILKIEKSNQPMVTLADSSDIKIGTDVLAIGYPASADRISDATVEPSNKDGKISNKRTEGGVPFYETSAATTQGMSGGPVANLNGEIIGLISHGPAGEQQAFNFLAASSVIAEELSENGVHNDLGKVDKDYRAGLDAYFDGQYSEAIAKFDAVLATIPSHAQAQEYRQQAVSLRQSEGEPADTTLLYVVIGAAVAVLLILVTVLVTLVVVRNRRRSRQTPLTGAYPMAPVAYPPIQVPTTPYPVSAASVPSQAPPVSALPVPVRTRAAISYCTNCGTGSPTGTRFCATCGNQFP